MKRIEKRKLINKAILVEGLIADIKSIVTDYKNAVYRVDFVESGSRKGADLGISIDTITCFDNNIRYILNEFLMETVDVEKSHTSR